MAETNNPRAQRFRSIVGEQSYDISIAGETVLVDEKTRDASLVQVRDGHYSMILDGRSYSMVIDSDEDGMVHVTVDGHRIDVQVQDEMDLLLERFGLQQTAADGVREVRAPMPGLVVRLLVEEGEAVAAGRGLVVLEAMKMENELKADADSTIKKIHVATGDAVSKNALLIEFEVQATGP